MTRQRIEFNTNIKKFMNCATITWWESETAEVVPSLIEKGETLEFNVSTILPCPASALESTLSISILIWACEIKTLEDVLINWRMMIAWSGLEEVLVVCLEEVFRPLYAFTYVDVVIIVQIYRREKLYKWS